MIVKWMGKILFLPALQLIISCGSTIQRHPNLPERIENVNTVIEEINNYQAPYIRGSKDEPNEK